MEPYGLRQRVDAVMIFIASSLNVPLVLLSYLSPNLFKVPL